MVAEGPPRGKPVDQESARSAGSARGAAFPRVSGAAGGGAGHAACVTLTRLVARHVLGQPARAGLLLGLVALTLFLVVFLRTIVTGLRAGVETAAPDRLMVQSGVGPMAELPAAYLESVRAVDGVESVARWSWFGGKYREGEAFFAAMAVDLDAVLAQYPEFVLPDEQRRAALADRRGCVVGAELARKNGWRVGDTIPIQGTIYPLDDGRAWELNVRGVYRSTDASMPELILFLHWEHLDETRARLVRAAAAASTVSLFSVKTARGRRPEDVAAAIDARYAGGPIRTRTQTERVHRAQEVGMLGAMVEYLGLIGAVVVAATLLMVGNAMGIAVGERRREAGILLALGFPDHVIARLVVTEAAVVTGLGGLVGTGAALAVSPFVRDALMFQAYAVRTETILLAIGSAALVGAVGGLLPGIRLGRVRPVEVFREEA